MRSMEAVDSDQWLVVSFADGKREGKEACGFKRKALRDERSACRLGATECDYWTDSVTVVLLVTGLAPPVVALMVTV